MRYGSFWINARLDRVPDIIERVTVVMSDFFIAPLYYYPVVTVLRLDHEKFSAPRSERR
jgi:hypothetical protein